MLIGDVSQGYSRHAVICDECHSLAEFMIPQMVLELKLEGWAGDWLCESCWERSPATDTDPFEFAKTGFIGFMEVEDVYTFACSNKPDITFSVARCVELEVSDGIPF